MDANIAHHVVSYYENIFKEDASLSQDYSILDSFNWNKVLEHQNLLLTMIPSDDEICEAIFGLDGSSSPGPDGFCDCFYHHCWDIIIVDVTRAISHLFTTSSIPPGMNSNLVTLIPKVKNFVRITDYHLIVMGNFTYKVYTKILATQLGSFIGGILSPFQFGFILGRCIHMCIALASDAINFLVLG